MKETLPKGWAVVNLDDVIIRMTNGANAVQYKEQVGLPISRIETISNETIDLDRVKYIKETDANFIDKYKLQNGDILFSHINSDSHLGKTALFKIENRVTLIHGINLLLLRPSPEILPEIINYQIKYLRAQGKFSAVAQKAVNQSSINQAKLKTFEICVPPLPEQTRILAKLEQLLTDLDKGIEYLTTAQQQLKVYRQAVLKWAFEGKLTNEDCLSQPIKRLNEICDIVGGVTKGKKFEGKSTVFVPYLRVANVQDGYLDLSVVKEIEVLPQDIDKYRLKEGDILYTEGGDRDKLGRGTIWRNEIYDCIHQNHIFRARPISKEINSKYIAYFSQTREARNYFFTKGKQTTNLASINLTVLSNLSIPTPTRKVQERIVHEIESRLSVCDKIEETIADSLQQAEALRLSIIKKAFEGKLVPQDPNDEPAEKLLERIRAEKKAAEQRNVYRKNTKSNPSSVGAK